MIFLILICLLVGVLQSFGILVDVHGINIIAADPVTIGVTAGAGLLYSALSPKPKMPSAPGAANIERFPEYQKEMMDLAKDPMLGPYRQAVEQSRGNINRSMAQRGLARSGVGLGAEMQMESDMANKLAANALQRRIDAYRAAVSPEVAQGQMQQQANQLAYQGEMAKYQQSMNERDMWARGIGGIAGGIAGYGAKNDWFSGKKPTPTETYSGTNTGVDFSGDYDFGGAYGRSRGL